MPLLRSAKKALRSSRRKRQQNTRVENELKTAVSKATKETASVAYSKIDKAVKRGLIHKNKAAHMKSKIAKKLGTPVARPSKGKATPKKVDAKKKTVAIKKVVTTKKKIVAKKKTS